MKRAQTYNSWETLSFSTKAEEKGFVSASIRGTSSEPAKFDDFSIQLKSVYQAKIYQENHYYPFGMNMKGLESSDKQSVHNKKEHEFQFNAQTEREESFGLFWDETPFRPMDMQLGRFWGVDLLAEIVPSMTPFHYSANNPISLNDPSGLLQESPDATNGGEEDPPPAADCDDCAGETIVLDEVTINAERAAESWNPIYRVWGRAHLRGDERLISLYNGPKISWGKTREQTQWSKDFYRMYGNISVAMAGGTATMVLLPALAPTASYSVSLPSLSTLNAGVELTSARFFHKSLQTARITGGIEYLNQVTLNHLSGKTYTETFLTNIDFFDVGAAAMLRHPLLIAMLQGSFDTSLGSGTTTPFSKKKSHVAIDGITAYLPGLISNQRFATMFDLYMKAFGTVLKEEKNAPYNK